MSQQTIVNSIKEHVNRQNNNWKFVMGKTVLTKKTFLEKLEKDRKFRKLITGMVVDLSVDILSRKAGK